MPYINAQLCRRKRLSLKNDKRDTEINKYEEVSARLNFSTGLSIEEVSTGLKMVANLQNSRKTSEAPLYDERIDADPLIPFFKRMDVVARDVRGPYVVPGTHRHRAQRVRLANGHGKYET